MRVSLKWLSDLVDVNLPISELTERLDMTGTAVEAVHRLGDTLENVVVGHILTKEPHPEADKLWVTSVDVGDGTPRTIVCGAQNFEAGDKVPVALPGAVLPGGFAIKKSKLRGIVSEGMNCSVRELGIGTEHEGIMILPADAPVGASFADWYGLADTVVELEVTPNRPDCLSMAGVAREIGAVLGVEATVPRQAPAEEGTQATDLATVSIDDDRLCYRYSARIIRGVKIGPSPAWLAERVIAAGARPINNVVDVTNFVLFELGQPLHAFDMATLAPGSDGRTAIEVRCAREGERLTTLDGMDRELSEDTLLICDSSGPVALAGVMGGEATEVSDATVDVLLESACFNPASISRTSRRLGLVSEASMRFERTVDRTGCVAAADRAAALIAEVAGGQVAPGVVDNYPAVFEPVRLHLRVSRLEQMVGTSIEHDDVSGILVRLGCKVVASAAADGFEVEVPSFRPDLEREIDLIEEVLRIWGMERVPPTLPGGRGRVGSLTATQRQRERIGQTLRSAGLNETMTYAFTDQADLEALDMPLAADESLVELLNPMSVEQAVLRRTLLAGLLRSVSYNQRRGVANVHLYETGSVYFTAQGRKQPKERLMTCGVLAGAWSPPAWNQDARALDFFDGKGVLETLARDLALPRFKVRPAERGWLQPGRAAEVLVSGEVIGWLGEVHPRVLERFECTPSVTAFEVDTSRLIRAASQNRVAVEPPKYPSVVLDVALVVPEEVTAERLDQVIGSAGGKLLEEARLFDVYRGPGIAEGHKSMAYALTYRAADRTLTAQEVETAHSKVVRKATAATGGHVRGTNGVDVRGDKSTIE